MERDFSVYMNDCQLLKQRPRSVQQSETHKYICYADSLSIMNG